ncbi:hypothetical protein CONLIGDRAFT_635076 [Coniochaeta ligniaria NRRL 30616]|uniref:Uncharacterized protein n=1 Tax=Coniochaeta ligniaria NRRL 30616 TaxID=1408157 RepID=A0A1J7IH85_9PEZI|nr:hypothetical protein CONLIGDRAFT_635076 [Coniochaeta ligniaria NRRL 30616]
MGDGYALLPTHCQVHVGAIQREDAKDTVHDSLVGMQAGELHDRGFRACCLSQLEMSCLHAVSHAGRLRVKRYGIWLSLRALAAGLTLLGCTAEGRSMVGRVLTRGGGLARHIAERHGTCCTDSSTIGSEGDSMNQYNSSSMCALDCERHRDILV